jgi:hypothetical protein
MVLRGYTKEPLESLIYSNSDLIEQAKYYRHVSNYLSYFPEKQFKIFLYDDLASNPYDFLSSVYNYISVPPIFPSNLSKKVNYTRSSKLPAIDKLISYTGDYLRKKQLFRIKKVVKSSFHIDSIKTYLGNDSSNLYTNRSEIKTKIINLLSEDLKQLNYYLNGKIEHWIRSI